MSVIENVSRRRLLQGLGVSGLLLGAAVVGYSPIIQAAAATPVQLQPNLFVLIGRDGKVTIVVSRSEMGTGIRTSLAMVLADELDADWRQVRVVQAQGDDKYGDQNTDGSKSVRLLFSVMREAGASARQMLIAAAAKRWNVDADTCRTADSTVISASGARFTYGELVADAVKQPTPGRDSLRLKSPDTWRYIGKPIPIVDLDDIVRGGAVYGIDMDLPEMKFASVERPPVYGGKVRSFDAKDALAVKGVEQVIEIPAPDMPAGFHPLGGVAVIAANTWAAVQARQKLKIEWDLGPNANYDTSAYQADLQATAMKSGKVVRNRGNVEPALQAAAKHVAADYFVPHLAHAMMEPEATVADARDGKCILWTASQNPQQTRTTVAEVLGVDPSAVTVNVTLLGGGFGRKSKPDYAAEAAFLSHMAGVPIKLTWTREDDITHGYYHAISVQHMEAGLDANGTVQAWLHRTVFPSIASTFTPNTLYGSAGELGQGVTDMPYDIPNIRCENGPAQAHVRIGWYRSVYNIPHGFAIGSFVDELAVAAGKDPVDFVLELLGQQRRLDLKAEGVDYPNYGASLEDYPIDIGRMRNVVGLVAERADWKGSLPARQGRGIAVHRSFLSYVAAVARVAVAPDGQVSVLRVDLAVDCGQIVNPDRVVAQFEGAAVMSISNALFSQVTFKSGRAEQTNFGDYQVARIDDVPETHVYIVPSSAPPGGVGEPGVPPVAAAVCNAIFRATGRRIRSLPVDPGQLKST